MASVFSHLLLHIPAEPERQSLRGCERGPHRLVPPVEDRRGAGDGPGGQHPEGGRPQDALDRRRRASSAAAGGGE